MARFFGCNPKTPTRQDVEKFENDVMIRHGNQLLVSTVYLDMQDNSWGVGIAYNVSRMTGIHGHENALEVRYSYIPGTPGTVNMFRSDLERETTMGGGPFTYPDAFARYVLKCERRVVNPTT